MSTTPLPATTVRLRRRPYSLSTFDELLAPLVAAWVVDDRELFWLAPRTSPPLTPGKVLAWPGRDASPRLFWRDASPEPLGYAELNPMPGEKDHLWLGHCLIRPEQRGCGLGRLMVDLLLEEGFVQRQAGRVSLVVFPDNASAIRCYRSTGFHHAGRQLKYFPTTGRQHAMIRMTLGREAYESKQPAR